MIRSRMRRGCSLIGVLCAATLLAAIPPQIRAQPINGGADLPARVIVKFKSDSPLLRAQPLSATEASVSRAQALSQRLGLAMSAGAVVSERAQVVFASGVSSAELARRLSTQSDVEYAVPDQRRRIVTAPNDPLYASGVPGNGPAVGQWYLRAPQGAVQSSLNIETAWAVTTGNPSVVVAVVDTGVRFEHPDLLAVAASGHLLPGYDMISDPVVANDGDGRDPDASDPGDWITAAEANNPNGPFYQCTPLDPSTAVTASAGKSRRIRSASRRARSRTRRARCGSAAANSASPARRRPASSGVIRKGPMQHSVQPIRH